MSELKFDEYQEKAISTAAWPQEARGIYPLLGLLGEAAEVADKFLDAWTEEEISNLGQYKRGVLDLDIRRALQAAIEAGQACEKLKKVLRGSTDKGVVVLLGSVPVPRFDEGMMKELGDTLWYLSACFNDGGKSLGSGAQENLDKLQVRKAAGMIHGVGDDREISSVPPGRVS